MRCTVHKKEFEGDCTWCGKKLCELCIAKKEGRKFYCEQCTAQLSMYRRQKLPKPASRKLPEEKQEQQKAKKPGKFVLDKDGYLVLGE